MSIIDLILLGIFAIFFFYGLFFGLIKSLGALVSFIIGVLVAAYFYQAAASWTGVFFPDSGLWRILVFIALFMIANRLTALIFSIVDKAFDILAIIPFLKSINRLAGAIFGAAEGLAVISLIFFIIANTGLANSWLGAQLASSTIAPYIVGALKLSAYYFPGFFEKLATLI